MRRTDRMFFIKAVGLKRPRGLKNKPKDGRKAGQLSKTFHHAGKGQDSFGFVKFWGPRAARVHGPVARSGGPFPRNSQRS